MRRELQLHCELRELRGSSPVPVVLWVASDQGRGTGARDVGLDLQYPHGRVACRGLTEEAHLKRFAAAVRALSMREVVCAELPDWNSELLLQLVATSHDPEAVAMSGSFSRYRGHLGRLQAEGEGLEERLHFWLLRVEFQGLLVTRSETARAADMLDEFLHAAES
jgi:hypothetical protein